jgi:signal transduction histidine kinase
VSDDQAPVARIKLVTLCLLALFLVGAAFTRTPENLLTSAIGIVIAVSGAAVTVRGVPPLHAVALSLVAGAGVVLASGASHTNLGYFGLCVVAFLCVLTAGLRLGGLFACVAVAFVVIKLASGGWNVGWLPWIGGVAVSALGAAVIVHEQRLLAQLEAAQADLAKRTRLQERARIARDLHDVIAHSLTVSLLHISAARMAVQHDPDDADRALAEAERLGRESLDEVRAIVGMARKDADEDGSSALTLTPGIESIEALAGRYRSAGAQIVVEMETDTAGIPATISTTAYRIAQEALTNAARHAAGWPVEVRLSMPNGSLELDVLSGGPPDLAMPERNGGHGLNSMRERAEAVGGALDAGPIPATERGGWRVHASLPVSPTRVMPCGREL